MILQLQSAKNINLVFFKKLINKFKLQTIKNHLKYF